MHHQSPLPAITKETLQSILSLQVSSETAAIPSPNRIFVKLPNLCWPVQRCGFKCAASPSPESAFSKVSRLGAWLVPGMLHQNPQSESECAASPSPKSACPKALRALSLVCTKNASSAFVASLSSPSKIFVKFAVPSAWPVPGTLRLNHHHLQACHPVLALVSECFHSSASLPERAPLAEAAQLLPDVLCPT